MAKKSRFVSWLKWLAFLAVDGIILIILARMVNPQVIMQNVLEWINKLGAWGAIFFIAIYIAATVLFIPGSLLTLGSGAIFGVLLGSVYVFVGASVGGTLAFLIGRYLARDWVAQQINGNSKFKAVDRAIAKEGFKIVLLARLSPVFPFNLLNYSLGITQVSLKDYIMGFVGMIPGTIMYVYIGSLAGTLARISSEQTNIETQRTQWIIRIIGFIATVMVAVYVTHVAKKALDQSASMEGENHHVPTER
jgi:uncharacterized membrane protein YdjX (TVP38/TMEM64 family)